MVWLRMLISAPSETLRQLAEEDMEEICAEMKMQDDAQKKEV
jgi:hypothetical protein